ncbi:cell division protein ZapA [Kiloniella laminariae]|uniref:cell division protein ZapA n=1 Tax=Kiloniella laminariae TaxID=454162 RepID=UPI000379FE66|nr:cell division protein ZapA [Kiloniella laminariae]
MAQVTLNVNGRKYSISCQDGQEDHLLGLSKYINQKIDELRGSMGQVSEAHLLLMAGLLLADELHEAYIQIDDGKTVGGEKSSANGDVEAEQVAAALESCADRLEDIAARLESQ